MCRKQVQARLRARNEAGNEKLLFHGTNRACLLGESSRNILLCGLKECYLCSILRASFDVKKCGKALLDNLLIYVLTLDRLEERFQEVRKTFGI
jgi:hypothetical protein